MYLKRLELHGFKTFASRTVLEFQDGVTAVVGPNGSGKSNLADAVRWALGEQSLRQVRCRQAEDLIFAGTSGTAGRGTMRPPMTMAEVILTFDNGSGWLPVDYSEVSIGRRLYRTGENEYLMNGARVRLRDITDLLARASISANGHLIIGQGLVDTVLNWRPEERRALIENLAGLRFYYSKRDDAETKLRAAEANLVNVDAMIAEAAPHIALLQEQAAAYAQYHEIEQELQHTLLQHYAYAYTQAVDKRARLAADLTAARQTLDTLRAEIETAERDITAARERARHLSGEAERLRADVRAAHAAREAAEREMAVARARREAAQTRLRDAQAGLPSLETQRAQAGRDLDDADAAARAASAERAELDKARAGIEQAVQTAAAEVGTAERLVRSLAERRRALETQEATIVAERAALQREEEAAQAEERRLAADKQALAKGVDDAQKAVVAARTALEAAAAAIEQARAVESRARLLAGEAAERARAVTAKRRAAERRAEELQARAAGLRAWLQAAGGGPQTGETVASLLVASQEIEPALAAALGPILAARPAAPNAHAVAALFEAGARHILLPGRHALAQERQDALLSALQTAGLPSEGIAGWADRLVGVQAASAHAAAVHAILSAVLVVRDLEAALACHHVLLWEADGAVPVLATLQGDALFPSGLLHRAAGESAAVLERVRELRAIEEEAAQADTELRQLKAEEERCEAERQHLASAAESALRALRAAEHERNDRRGAMTAAERAEVQARREAQWAAERRRRATEAAAARQRRRSELDGQQQEIERARTVLEPEEARAVDRHDKARDGLEQATARRAGHGAALALANGRAAEAERRRRTAAEMLARLDNELRQRRSITTQLEEEIQTLGQREEEQTHAVAEATARLRALHEQLRPLETALSQLEQRIADGGQHLTALRQRETAAATEHETAALAYQRAEHEIEALRSGLHADLALAPDDLPPPAPAQPGLQGRIKSLRARLASFGPINARAPEDLAAAEERRHFLETQAADLRAAIARLRGLIAEANSTVRERYGTVAGELDAQFRLYLQRLFGGGRGELTALYDADGLPSGLDIAVQPPGKRTRELSLLSGGERALVGLALVFAMLAVRPVPFCVLDEAEAALDEANTLRVGDILRHLSARTQFIVITHNRGTMSHADALYGVTMAESGISQIAGIRLEDIEVVRRSRAG